MSDTVMVNILYVRNVLHSTHSSALLTTFPGAIFRFNPISTRGGGRLAPPLLHFRRFLKIDAGRRPAFLRLLIQFSFTCFVKIWRCLGV